MFGQYWFNLSLKHLLRMTCVNCCKVVTIDLLNVMYGECEPSNQPLEHQLFSTQSGALGDGQLSI